MTEWMQTAEKRDRGEWLAVMPHPLASKPIRVHVFCNDDADALSEAEADGMTRLMAFGPDRLPEVRALLFPHAKLCCETTDYGFDFPDGVDETKANLAEIGIATEADAFAPEWVRSGHVGTDGSLRARRPAYLSAVGRGTRREHSD